MNILAYFEIFEGNLTRLYSPYIYKSKCFKLVLITFLHMVISMKSGPIQTNFLREIIFY